MIYLLHDSLDQLFEDLDEQIHPATELSLTQRQAHADQNFAPRRDEL